MPPPQVILIAAIHLCLAELFPGLRADGMQFSTQIAYLS
jgi:hypothetical protein